MTCKKALYVLLTLLIVVNIGLVYLHFFAGPPHKHHHDPMHSWMDQSLQLTDQQEVQHVKMRRDYFDKLGEINDTLRGVKARFIAQSAQQELTDTMANTWADSIHYWNRRADELTYRFVRSVRSMLTPKQQPVYDSLIQIIMLRKRD